MMKVKTLTGEIIIDPSLCEICPTSPCVGSCSLNILKRQGLKIEPAFPEDEIRNGRCTECLACELACHLNGLGGLLITLPLPTVSD